jgi:ComF family protein
MDFDAPHPHICDKCTEKIKISPIRVCPKCGRPMDMNAYAPYCFYCAGQKARFKYLVSPLLYDEVCSDIVKKFKYNDRVEIAKSLAPMIWERIKEYDKDLEFDIIIPAPSSKTRGLKLRTEHMKIFCEELSRISGVPTKELLFKKEGTKNQNSLNAKERKTNLKGKIKYTGGAYNKVLLVDDIYTTGATADECSLMLKKAGCKEIYVGIITVNICDEFD